VITKTSYRVFKAEQGKREKYQLGHFTKTHAEDRGWVKREMDEKKCEVLVQILGCMRRTKGLRKKKPP